MKFVAVTPEKTVVDTDDAQFVVVPLYDGEYGIDVNHSPVVGRLGVGELRLILGDSSVQRWFVDGGFVEVANNVITILTDRAYPSSELNIEDARKKLDVALALPANSLALADIRTDAVKRAKVMLSLAERVAHEKNN